MYYSNIVVTVLLAMAAARFGPLPVEGEGTDGLATALAELCPKGLLWSIVGGKAPRVVEKDKELEKDWREFCMVQALMMQRRLALPFEEARLVISNMTSDRGNRSHRAKEIDSTPASIGNWRNYNRLPGPSKDIAEYLKAFGTSSAAIAAAFSPWAVVNEDITAVYTNITCPGGVFFTIKEDIGCNYNNIL